MSVHHIVAQENKIENQDIVNLWENRETNEDCNQVIRYQSISFSLTN